MESISKLHHLYPMLQTQFNIWSYAMKIIIIIKQQ